MVLGLAAEMMDVISNPPSLEAQVDALKQLKNDIVGHDQRKAQVVRQGVVEPLVGIISASTKASGKKKLGDGNKATPGQSSRPQWTLDDDARLQAILILGSLASGGRAFVQPLQAAATQKHLLDVILGDTSPALVKASLQALRNLAASAATGGCSGDQPSLDIFSPNVEPAFQQLLSQPISTTIAKQQVKLVTEIISLSTTDEATRDLHAEGSTLNTLVSLLVSHGIANQHFDHRGSWASSLPPPPPVTIIPHILSAIAAIITGSRFRVQCFILALPLREAIANGAPDHSERSPLTSRPSTRKPIEHLLPSIYVPTSRSISFNAGSNAFPALASLQPGNRASGESDRQAGNIEHANAVCDWLLVLARSMRALSRLHALRLLALVNNAVEVESMQTPQRSESVQRAKERERKLTLLAIPISVDLIQGGNTGQPPISIIQDNESHEVKEQACEVLALLVQGNKELQVTAVEAGAIKRICPLLKKSFDNVNIAKPMWSANRSQSNQQGELSESCKLGSPGLSPEVLHAMRCRQSALEALAALAKREDIHRKSIVEAGVVGCIIDSLNPFPADLLNEDPTKKIQITPKDGNTTPAILAACHAAQSMSRSVSLLRTSLIDAGIAKPIFELLTHQDLQIQIAATDVCCNLLLEFSPMREDLIASGAIKTLTEHARQSEMGLRLASMWALKHLVLQSPKEIKIQCLEELGTGWLVGAIQGEHKDTAPIPPSGGVSIGPAGGLSTPNAAGEQVDLLNPTSMDLDEPPGGNGGEDVEDDEDEDGEVMYDEASSTHYQASQLRSTLHPPLGPASAIRAPSPFSVEQQLSSVRDQEQNPVLRAKKHDVAVQEQALDFVRNMLNGDDCAFMLEHFLAQVGVEKLFCLLADKLAPVSSSGPATRSAGNNALSSRQIYQPTELILSTVHVLTHIANGSPKHKQLLIAQKQLLQNWLPHFNHSDRRVRIISVWAVNSLTWVEDDADRPDAAKRGRELKACGIEGAIRGLVNDTDLDVRERVRTAVRQLEGL